MSGRRLIQIALLAVVAATVAIVLRPQAETTADGTSAVDDELAAGTTYVAYYFHGDVRCDTCRSIEAQAEAAVQSGFPDELANGALDWRVVNTDQPENAHFVQEYQLTHSTVVLAEREGGTTRRFSSLDRVWELVHDEDDSFQNYVQGEIANWLQSDS